MAAKSYKAVPRQKSRHLETIRLIRGLRWPAYADEIDRLSKVSEDCLQAALCSWLDYQKVTYFAVPNGGKRTKAEAIALKLTGVKPGVPDLVIPIPSQDYHGMFIELKHLNNTTTPHQKAWLQTLVDAGYHCVVVKNLESAQALIKAYLKYLPHH
jgi:hypothetical protein